MKKITLTKVAIARDGGTIKYLGDDGKYYWEDHRIGSTCKGAIWDKYPEDLGADLAGGDFVVGKPVKYNEAADKYLNDLYSSVGATTPEQQYNTLFMKLGYHLDGTVVNFSHSPTWEQKRGMMEYDLLEREGLIDLVLV